MLDSILINKKQLALLASWIDSIDNDEINFNLSKNAYEFKLLIQGSRDGMGLREFHKLCLNKGPTLVIIKSDVGKIIGGYNPESWSFSGLMKYLEDDYYYLLIFL